jgi:ethanolamine transporter EutH
MITAKLICGELRGKIKIMKPRQEIKMFVALPVSAFNVLGDCLSSSSNRKQVLVFEWRKQTGKYTHEYSIKEII